MNYEMLTGTSPNGKLDASCKVKPPFPNLAVFNVSALILAFVAYADDVEALLNLLSRRTQKYYQLHKDILSSFLVPWQPKISLIEFGATFYAW